MDDVLPRDDLRDDKNYGVHYHSKHFEHIVDFLTPFLRPVPSIEKETTSSTQDSSAARKEELAIKTFWAQPYKYSTKGEKMIDFLIGFKLPYILFFV